MSEMWEVMVPTVSNDGRPFRTKHHREWDRQVREIAGGLTIYKPATGIWVDRIRGDGDVYRERMIPVRIACSRDDFIRVMTRVQKHYSQIDVMGYKVSEDVIFLSKETGLSWD